MSTLVYLFAYTTIAIFVLAVVIRFVRYLRNPIHVRWELYPVAHEGEKAVYGGGYLEETDWWTKPRNKSMIGELKVMVPEILLLKAVFEHNRALWLASFPFHAGLYLVIGVIGLCGLSAIAAILSLSSMVVQNLNSLADILALVGFVGVLLGANGLLLKRLFDENMRNYSALSHYFNLLLFIVAAILGLMAWSQAPSYAASLQGFIAGLLSFGTASTTLSTSEPVFVGHLVLSLVLVAYIPLTHMAHFFMKYFLYHDIRWGDEANVDTPQTDAKIATVLNYPITWAAPHIRGDGSRKTWAEVATFNPARADEAGKDN